MPAKPHIFRNGLLSALSPADQALLAPDLQPRSFKLRHVFVAPNRPIKAVYFIEHGIASVVARSGGNDSVEVGLIGREGLSAICILLGGDRCPHSTYAQVAGSALCIDAQALREKMNRSASLRGLLLKFALVYMLQISQTALANGRFKLEERLARWILMAHDRIDGEQLPLTHEFLSIMLGVRRAGVTVALQHLQSRGLVRSSRRQIEVVDRGGLERLSNGAYGVPEAEYRRLIG